MKKIHMMDRMIASKNPVHHANPANSVQAGQGNKIINRQNTKNKKAAGKPDIFLIIVFT